MSAILTIGNTGIDTIKGIDTRTLRNEDEDDDIKLYLQGVRKRQGRGFSLDILAGTEEEFIHSGKLIVGDPLWRIVINNSYHRCCIRRDYPKESRGRFHCGSYTTTKGQVFITPIEGFYYFVYVLKRYANFFDYFIIKMLNRKFRIKDEKEPFKYVSGSRCRDFPLSANFPWEKLIEFTKGIFAYPPPDADIYGGKKPTKRQLDILAARRKANRAISKEIYDLFTQHRERFPAYELIRKRDLPEALADYKLLDLITN